MGFLFLIYGNLNPSLLNTAIIKICMDKLYIFAFGILANIMQLVTLFYIHNIYSSKT